MKKSYKIKKLFWFLISMLFLIFPTFAFWYSHDLDIKYNDNLPDDFKTDFFDSLDADNLYKLWDDYLSWSLFNEFSEYDYTSTGSLLLNLQWTNSDINWNVTWYFNYQDISVPTNDYSFFLYRIITLLNDIRILLLTLVTFFMFYIFVLILRPLIYYKKSND